MTFLQTMQTAQEQQAAALEAAHSEGRAYTLVSIGETLTMGRNADGRMVYNGKVF